MRIAVSNLVMIILAGAALIMVLAITAVFNTTATDNVNTCAASVAVRAGQVAASTPGDAHLHGCTTEQKNVTGGETQVRTELSAAYMRCKLMFGPAANKRLARDTSTYCHICGIYDVQQLDEVQNLHVSVNEAGDKSIYDVLSVSDVEAPKTLSTTNPIGILFVQTTDIDHTLWSWLTQPLTSRTPVIGGMISSPSAQVASGIVISEYGPELIEQLGCTTIDPSTT